MDWIELGLEYRPTQVMQLKMWYVVM